MTKAAANGNLQTLLREVEARRAELRAQAAEVAAWHAEVAANAFADDEKLTASIRATTALLRDRRNEQRSYAAQLRAEDANA